MYRSFDEPNSDRLWSPGQHLLGHDPSKPGVVGGIHHAHTAATDLGVNEIVGNPICHECWIIAVYSSQRGR